MSTSATAVLEDLHFRRERPEDAAVVERLIARAFGPGRYAKSADRLREGRTPERSLSLVAWSRGDAVGCVRLWTIHIGDTPALLLGPFAVDAAHRSRGLGAALVEAACLAAAAAGHSLVLLVGDAPFFSRVGFEPVEPGRVVLPGPVDTRRVLWRALVPGAWDNVSGAVRP